MISSWLAFWDSPHSIYVSARHKDVHYRLIAREIAALIPGPQARVLDYGAGEALHADELAAAAGELLLCEGAPGLRAALAARFAGHSKVRVLAPDEVARLPAQALDLVKQTGAQRAIDPGHRLIKQHEPRLGHQRAGELQQFALPS